MSAFTAGVASTATTGVLYALQGQALCVVRTDAGVTLPALTTLDPDTLHLGTLDGIACFARALGRDEPLPAGTEAVPLRQLYGVLSDDEFGIAGQALGFTTWDRDHRHCGRCGAPTLRSLTERVRTCTACSFGAYPRLSPAVIVLVERDGHCLLARNARTQMPFFSTLAGFVEVGESLEGAVAREIREEAGIELADIRYFGSQPWPFTGSLMVGFTARWASGALTPEPTELLDAGWFAPRSLPTVPPKLSIARELIDDFVRRHT